MILNAEQVIKALLWSALVDALSDIFTRSVQSPVRHHLHLPVPRDPEATLLLMPAWLEGVSNEDPAAAILAYEHCTEEP
ncbi:hypothetical protein [Billgrantia diversa]|uniref:hypothetical protein n=1 Tax=Halomonas sp. MCCC 1A13316 TaxID=2733487 RepID=UPI0018D33B58|nr:hypothetical protein [Halomonas sp. MCCC 1A13316]